MTAILESRPIAEIKIGERFRRKLNLNKLIASVQVRGLLRPLTITSDGLLVGGLRRLEAVRALGDSTIDCHVCEHIDDVLADLRQEREIVQQRWEMQPSEVTAQIRVLYAIYDMYPNPKPERDPRKPSAVRRDHVGAAVGLNGRVVTMLRRVDNLLTDPNPQMQSIGHNTLAEMDRTGSLDGPGHRMYQQIRMLNDGQEVPAEPQQLRDADGRVVDSLRWVKRSQMLRPADRVAVLERAAETVSNITSLVDLILERAPNAEEFSDEQRQEWAARLRAGRYAITRLIRHMEGTTRK